MVRKISKGYNIPNKKIIDKYIQDVIHNHNMQTKLSMIKKEVYNFALLFIGDGATISRTPLLNRLVSGKKFL